MREIINQKRGDKSAKNVSQNTTALHERNGELISPKHLSISIIRLQVTSQEKQAKLASIRVGVSASILPAILSDTSKVTGSIYHLLVRVKLFFLF